jgi:hypothetical protein
MDRINGYLFIPNVLEIIPIKRLKVTLPDKANKKAIPRAVPERSEYFSEMKANIIGKIEAKPIPTRKIPIRRNKYSAENQSTKTPDNEIHKLINRIVTGLDFLRSILNESLTIIIPMA